jgi:hypothetical protein
MPELVEIFHRSPDNPSTFLKTGRILKELGNPKL